VRAEIVAVGSELLLGHHVDTNSTFIAAELAASGIDCHFQTRVGDNIDRIVAALEVALARSEAVIVCGGLGPTHDDVTREAIAKVMGAELLRDKDVLERTRAIFAKRGRQMSPNNEKQADVPVGARVIAQAIGTAPGLICPVGEKVVYAVPGVPEEMKEMVRRAVLPDLEARSTTHAVIASRTLRTCGLAESLLAQTLAPRVEALQRGGEGVPTIAFLASGINGINVRITVKTADAASAKLALDAEEAALRALLGERVFGIDEESMEHVVGALLLERGWKLGLAESFTGGLISSRIVAEPGASSWYVGALVCYASSVKHEILGMKEGPVVTKDGARAMAEGIRRLLGAVVGLSTTGVAGPNSQEGLPPGTAFAGIALPGEEPEVLSLSLSGGRDVIREIATITALDALRRRLLLSCGSEERAQGS
jgi:nicotinamide-nucleotide amidase